MTRRDAGASLAECCHPENTLAPLSLSLCLSRSRRVPAILPSRAHRHHHQPHQLPHVPIPAGVLHKRGQHLTARLQQRMADDDLQEALQALAAVLDDVVAEAVRKDLAGQRRDGDAAALALEDVAKVLKVGVAAAHARGLELEGGNVGAAEDLVAGVHGAADAVGLGVADLGREASGTGGGRGDGEADLDLEEVLGGAVDLFEALGARVRKGLHVGG